MQDEKLQALLRVVLVNFLLTLLINRLADKFTLKRFVKIQTFLEINLVTHSTSKLLVNAADFFVVDI